jgi:subtilisin family serine protease
MTIRPGRTPITRILLFAATLPVLPVAHPLSMTPGVDDGAWSTVAPAAAEEFEYRATPSRLDPRLRSFQRRIEAGRAERLSAEELATATAPMFGRGAVMALAGGRIGVDCFVRAGAEGFAELERLGIEMRTRVGDIATATIPVDLLDLLEDLPGLRQVEMSRPLKPFLDVSLPNTGGNMVHGASMPPYPMSGYTGRDVVVGVIDTGIDIAHGDFKNPGGMTRIESLWDQVNPNGPAPAGFGYGREWTAAQIDGGTAASPDTDGHGSHVAGIAAGDGSDTGNGQAAFQFVGVAPEATILGVKTNFTTGGVADGVSYIFNKAGVRDAVVNLSLGTQDGPHDGTSLFDQQIGQLVGNGRIIVAAAGNESNAGIHARMMVGAVGDSAVFTFTVPNYSPNPGGTTQNPNDFLVIDGWYEGDDNFTFRAESPLGRRSPEMMIGARGASCLPSIGGAGGDGRVFLENAFAATFNGDREIYIEVTEGSVGSNCQVPRSGTWKIIAYKKAGSSGPGVVDFWVANAFLGGAGAYPSFVQGVSNDYLVGSPASAPGVISVGAFITKYRWPTAPNGSFIQYTGFTDADLGTIAPFSSPGPLRNDMLAPTLSAPGMGIGSTRSTNAGISPNFALQDLKHSINQGTSQASPHVAGAVALIMERYPHESPENVMRRLTETAVRDARTGASPGPVFGYGKLDIVGALEFDTPVLLSSFEAEAFEGGVRLRWVVANDDPFVGFHVSRAPAPRGPFERVTTSYLVGEHDFEWLDPSALPGVSYWYRLEALEIDGTTSLFGPITATAGAPRLMLAQNGPNPFSASTTIGFALPEAGPVSLRVFDPTGRLIRTLFEGIHPVGAGEVAWDGLDRAGRPAAAGVYFYRLDTHAGRLTKKMILDR